MIIQILLYNGGLSPTTTQPTNNHITKQLGDMAFIRITKIQIGPNFNSIFRKTQSALYYE